MGDNPQPSDRSRRFAIVGWVLTCLVVGVLGSIATASSVKSWYPTLAKPGFQPPSWVFGPVWTTLYVMMGIAAWRVWLTSPGPDRRTALRWFALQLALNLGWSILFFGLRRPDLALVEIVALWGALLLTAAKFYRRDAAAGWLLVPYVAWVTFAFVLNFAIWRLNGAP